VSGVLMVDRDVESPDAAAEVVDRAVRVEAAREEPDELVVVTDQPWSRGGGLGVCSPVRCQAWRRVPDSKCEGQRRPTGVSVVGLRGYCSWVPAQPARRAAALSHVHLPLDLLRAVWLVTWLAATGYGLAA
jgi:hypothetical protein